jgi:hypothetical protein
MFQTAAKAECCRKTGLLFLVEYDQSRDRISTSVDLREVCTDPVGRNTTIGVCGEDYGSLMTCPFEPVRRHIHGQAAGAARMRQGATKLDFDEQNRNP